MEGRVSFSKYEAAILLDGYLNVVNNVMTRNEAILKVSEKLRLLAINSGEVIDASYRNVAGITFQMHGMESAYCGRTLFKPASKLFSEIVELYRNDVNEYYGLLKIASEKLSVPFSLEAVFFSWLKNETKNAPIQSIKELSLEISTHCIERNIIRKSIFQIYEAKEIKKIRAFCESNKVFRYSYKGKLTLISSFLRSYTKFLEEIGPIAPLVFDDAKNSHSVIEEKTDEKENNSVVHQDGQTFSCKLATPNDPKISSNGIKCVEAILSLNKQNATITSKEISKQTGLSLSSSLLALEPLIELQYISINSGIITINYDIWPQLPEENTSLDLIKKEDSNDQIDNSEELTLEQKCNCLLDKYFSEDGYQLGRAIFKGRFLRYYESEFSDTLASSIDFEAVLSNIGILIEGRVFPKTNQQDTTVEQIVNTILETLNSGVSAVFCDAVFERFQNELASDSKIYNVESMNSLLVNSANGQFICKYSYFVLPGNEADSSNDILQIMKEFHQPKSYDEIHEKAWFISIYRLKSLLITNKSIVNVDSEKYFYAPNLPVNTNELKMIVSIIGEKLSTNSYITGSEMVSLVEKEIESFAVNTENFTVYGLRNCLGYLLRDYFSFNGPIISKKGVEISMADAFEEFADRQSELSLDELKSFAYEMDISIYWESVFTKVVRVSEELMVKKEFIDFNVEEIDKLLDDMCPGDYMPLKDIGLFLHFPNIGYKWNSFLLESYLYQYSKMFTLLHVSFSQNGVFGIMVRNSSPFKEYREVLIDSLSRSNSLNSIDNALDFIVNNGFQQRRKLNGIEDIVKRAKLIKETRKRE